MRTNNLCDSENIFSYLVFKCMSRIHVNIWLQHATKVTMAPSIVYVSLLAENHMLLDQRMEPSEFGRQALWHMITVRRSRQMDWLERWRLLQKRCHARLRAFTLQMKGKLERRLGLLEGLLTMFALALPTVYCCLFLHNYSTTERYRPSNFVYNF